MRGQVLKSTFQIVSTTRGTSSTRTEGSGRSGSRALSIQPVPKLDGSPPRTPLIWAGGKASPLLFPPIAGAIDLAGIDRFVEAFAGGGALSLAVLRDTDLPVWLNDLDAAIAHFWRSVFNGAIDRALAKLRATKQAPTRLEFVAMQRRIRAGSLDLYEILVVARLSRSGTFTRGGMRSDAAKRWEHRDRWCRTIEDLRGYADRVVVSNRDGITMIDELTKKDIAYVDPPYPNVGDSLYRNRMSMTDHKRLADALSRTTARWLMSGSADATPLYDGWCEIAEIGKSGRGTIEVIITPR